MILESTSNYIEQEKIFHGFIPRIMWTRFDLLISDVDSAQGENIWSQVVAELQRLDKMLNRFDSTSEVSRLNQKAIRNAFQVSNEFWNILMECKKYFQLTNGIFDVTLKDFSQINFHIDSQSISFETSDISLDFGGYAKGYALEKIKNILQKEKIQNAFVDFGNSSILALGTHPYGDSWKVSIENPFEPGSILDEFSLEDSTLTTSGNTPNYTNHIVNPISASGVVGNKCVCIITDNACDGEVLSTTLMAAPPDEKQKIMTNFEVENVVEYNL